MELSISSDPSQMMWSFHSLMMISPHGSQSMIDPQSFPWMIGPSPRSSETARLESYSSCKVNSQSGK